MNAAIIYNMKILSVIKAFLAIMVLMMSSIAIAFDPAESNLYLDKLSILLHKQPMSAEELIKTQKDLVELKKKAEACITEKTKELEEINQQLPDLSDPEKVDVELTKDQQYLIQKRIETIEKLSGCKLFALRSTELIALFADEAKAKKKITLLGSTDPIINILPNFKSSFIEWYQQINITSIIEKPGYSVYAATDYLVILILLMIVFCITYYMRLRIDQYAESDIKKSPVETDFANLLLIIKNHIGRILTFSAVLAYESVHDYIYEHDLIFDTFLKPIILYLVVSCIIDLVTHPPISSNLFNFRGKKYKESFCNSLKVFSLVLIIGYFTNKNLVHLPENEIVFSFAVVLFYTVIALNLFLIFKSFIYLTRYFDKKYIQKNTLTFLNTLFLIFNIIWLWTGHIHLSAYLLKGIIFSFFIISLSLAVYTFLMSMIEKLFAKQHKWKQKVFRFIQQHRSDLMLEVVTFKIVLFLVIWGWVFIQLNSVWSISELWTLQLRKLIFEGIAVAETQLIPIRIIFALMFFALTTLAIKILKFQLQPKETSITRAEQEAYLTIMSYIAILFSIVFALVIAGIDLKGLAFVAGALSVGIGFGLQNIVNNFVSGLVLLIERPIRKGDRILVGDKEGFVTDIGVRSTTILTLEKSHLVVPNSDLVTKEVKNYMVNNKKSRLKLEVRLMHNADTKRVKEILYEAANTHPEVSKEKGDEPMVYCLGYFENALQLNLWFTIFNVNMKFPVRSDLYFFVDDKLKAEGIEYAYTYAKASIDLTNNRRLQRPPDA